MPSKEQKGIKRYVLTGPSSSGKTSLLLYLELFYDQLIIRESAEDIIRLKKAMGISNPWDERDLQILIYELHKKREKYESLINLGRVFYDRSYLDMIAFLRPNLKEDSILLSKIKNTISKIKYDLVFFIEPINTFDKQFYRREKDLSESVNIGNTIKEIYSMFGYRVITIPYLAIAERAKIIMEHIMNYENNYEQTQKEQINKRDIENDKKIELINV